MPVKRITTRMLSDRFGGSERFWQKRLAALVHAGLLNRIGRLYFGDMTAIDHAVASGGTDIWNA